MCDSRQPTDGAEAHEHNPGCMYQSFCSCGWKSNIGSHDNAFYTAWDHSHGEGASLADREMYRAHKEHKTRIEHA